jgi:hypothetical protein
MSTFKFISLTKYIPMILASWVKTQTTSPYGEPCQSICLEWGTKDIRFLLMLSYEDLKNIFDSTKTKRMNPLSMKGLLEELHSDIIRHCIYTFQTPTSFYGSQYQKLTAHPDNEKPEDAQLMELIKALSKDERLICDPFFLPFLESTEIKFDTTNLRRFLVIYINKVTEKKASELEQ